MTLMSRYRLTFLALLALAAPLAAKDSLGIFGDWGAFRDPSIPRCYAIARPQATTETSDYSPYATVGTWPLRKVRGQVHFRLSRKLAKDGTISLRVGSRSFALTGGGGDAWAKDKAMDAAIVAAMRSAPTMRVRARDASGRAFSDSYRLTGAASAMDAATVACVATGSR